MTRWANLSIESVLGYIEGGGKQPLMWTVMAVIHISPLLQTNM